MPTYAYRCTNPECAHTFDVVQAFTDASLTECPVCGQTLRKVFSPVGVVFKGSGFYRNDSRGRSESSEKADAKGSSDSGGSSEKGSSEKSSASSDKGSADKGSGGSSEKSSATTGGGGSGSSGSGSSGSGSAGSGSSGSSGSGTPAKAS